MKFSLENYIVTLFAIFLTIGVIASTLAIGLAIFEIFFTTPMCK